VFDHGGARRAAEKMGIRFLGEVPLDLRVREAGDQGMPIVAGDPEGAQAQAFFAIARQVAGAVSTQAMKAPRLPVIGGAQPRA
jgi:ATP-binding protein involved in chromosome partitioning